MFGDLGTIFSLVPPAEISYLLRVGARRRQGDRVPSFPGLSRF